MTSDTLLRQQLDEALNGLQFSVDNISEGDTFNFKTISPAMNSYLIDKLMALVSKAVEEAQETAEYWQQFGEHYEVSTLGRVRRNGKILKQSNRVGYRVVSLSIDNKQKTMLVHRMVALRFLPNPENKPQVNHIDGDKANNVISNLEWCTPGENEQHSYSVLGKVTWNKGKFQKPFCMRGHVINEETTHLKPSGKRYCKKCQTEWQRERRSRLKAKLTANATPQEKNGANHE